MFADELITNNASYDTKQAIICGSNNITYEQFRVSVNKMSQLLINNNVKPNDHVIICMSKSIEYIIGIYGVLAIGAAYVPLDETMPKERFSYISNNCNATVVITDSETCKNIQLDNQKYIVIDHYEMKCDVVTKNCIGWDPSIEVQDIVVHERSTKDIAYIIYTSGSTGSPKGVMIRHDSLVAFIQSVQQIVQYSSETRYLNVSPFYFDASVLDIFCTLYVGGTLVLLKSFKMPNKLLNMIVDYEITDTLLVSSILKLLTSRFVDLHKFDFSKLRTIWYGAESCPVKVLRSIKEAIPHIKFIHGYGPTEATHTTTMLVFDELPNNENGYMPIGKPLPNVEVMALDDNQKLIKENEVGMLYIGGLQLFEGYCNDPIKNETFVFPNFMNTGKCFYKTNDMVTIDQDGNYVYVGRADDMIKISGKLVYISEVESILLKCNIIKDAIVVTIEDEFFAKKMICFVVFREGQEGNFKELLEFSKKNLQNYMIPSKFYQLDENDIPRNQNDKINRKELEKLIKKMDCENFG